MKLLVTGGAGFIGSNFIHYLFESYGNDVRVVNLDKLTYAGNLENLKSVEDRPGYIFIHGDICDPDAVRRAMKDVEIVVNFAAETHVDRSIGEPDSFLKTDVFGVYVLVEEALKQKVKLFVQISTDEVYGECMEGHFNEEAPLKPRSPYAAGKAGGDRLAHAYHETYGLPVLITRCSNNFGPFQYPEKLIPLFITNALEDQPLPVYGDGRQARDWIHVRDHCTALDLLLSKGTVGDTYNIGAGNEWLNINITRKLLKFLDKPESLIRHVTDRPGHDRRYALNSDKLKALGWTPRTDMDTLLSETVAWYADHREWWKPLKSGEFKEYYKKQYGERLKG